MFGVGVGGSYSIGEDRLAESFLRGTHLSTVGWKQFQFAKFQIEGLQIPEPLLISNSKCPLKVQNSQGLGPFFRIELLKTGRTTRCSPRRKAQGRFVMIITIVIHCCYYYY